MYSTCIFCNQDLGKNEVVEHFPIGRRLAFDASKGRLWVVCRHCERWNLTPLEERWEAIEEAERLFSMTKLRVSTDNIGLAKLSEGLELVRIGSALRPEIAIWRYGDQFGRRRRKHMVLTGAGVAAIAGMVVLGPMTGVIAGGGWGSWQIITFMRNLYNTQRVRVRLKLPEYDRNVVIRREALRQASVVRVEDDWALNVHYQVERNTRRWAEDGTSRAFSPGRALNVTLRGQDALRVAGKILPAVNEEGAKATDVQTAVRLVGEVGDPNKLFQRYAGSGSETHVAPRSSRSATQSGGYAGHRLRRLPTEVRLALEMAAHEEQERRALEGELALLEAAWKEAEEVAHIADDMFLPSETDDQLNRLRKG